MRGIARYRTNSVKSAPPRQLVTLLLEEALKRLVLAEDEQAGGDFAVYIGHLHHVREILLELQAALDHAAAPELCAQLSGLYTWCMDELIIAGRDKTPERIHAVGADIQAVLEGWRTLTA